MTRPTQPTEVDEGGEAQPTAGHISLLQQKKNKDDQGFLHTSLVWVLILLQEAQGAGDEAINPDLYPRPPNHEPILTYLCRELKALAVKSAPAGQEEGGEGEEAYDESEDEGNSDGCVSKPCQHVEDGDTGGALDDGGAGGGGRAVRRVGAGNGGGC